MSRRVSRRGDLLNSQVDNPPAIRHRSLQVIQASSHLLVPLAGRRCSRALGLLLSRLMCHHPSRRASPPVSPPHRLLISRQVNPHRSLHLCPRRSRAANLHHRRAFSRVCSRHVSRVGTRVCSRRLSRVCILAASQADVRVVSQAAGPVRLRHLSHHTSLALNQVYCQVGSRARNRLISRQINPRDILRLNLPPIPVQCPLSSPVCSPVCGQALGHQHSHLWYHRRNLLCSPLLTHQLSHRSDPPAVLQFTRLCNLPLSLVLDPVQDLVVTLAPNQL